MTPAQLLATSRKHLVFLYVLLVVAVAAIGFEVVIVVLCMRGKLEIQAGMGLAFGGVVMASLGAVVAGSKLIDAIASEDNAKRAPPSSTAIATSGPVNVDQSSPAPASTTSSTSSTSSGGST